MNILRSILIGIPVMAVMLGFGYLLTYKAVAGVILLAILTAGGLFCCWVVGEFARSFYNDVLKKDKR